MTLHADILDEQDPLRGAFLGAIGLHVTVVGAIAIYGSMAGHTQLFGAKDAGGGAIGIEAVNSIPLPHRGMPNPLANDTKAEIPQTPAKPIERQKEEKPPPDAIALKSRKAKKPPAQVASERQRFRPFKELEQNQLTVKESPAVASPMFSAIPGAGRVGIGANTTLGTRFAGYAQQIQQLVAQKWRTSDIDPRVQTAPVVIVMFDLLRDGSVRNLRILQRSGIPALDFSAQRAILEASPFPPIPPGFEHDVAEIESDFELKR
jgi:TonB family protein